VQSTAGQPTLQWQARNGDGWAVEYDGGASSTVVYASDGVYAAAPNTRVFRSNNDGASYPTSITPWGTTSDQGAFITSIATRPGTAGTVYACGNQNLWQSLNNGNNWRIVDSRGGPGDIAVSPTNGNYVVHAVGRRVFLSTNALAATVGGPNGVQFADITRNLPNNGRNVQRVAFDPIDPTVIYAVLGGFDGPLTAQQGHVFRTTAASTTWTDISPPVDIPMGAIALDATTTPATIYIGTDLGVVRTVDLGRSWSVVDDIHLPKVPVTDLEFSDACHRRAADLGRPGQRRPTHTGSREGAQRADCVPGFVSSAWCGGAGRGRRCRRGSRLGALCDVTYSSRMWGRGSFGRGPVRGPARQIIPAP
jgi:hypothetical protein